MKNKKYLLSAILILHTAIMHSAQIAKTNLAPKANIALGGIGLTTAGAGLLWSMKLHKEYQQNQRPRKLLSDTLQALNSGILNNLELDPDALEKHQKQLMALDELTTLEKTNIRQEMNNYGAAYSQAIAEGAPLLNAPGNQGLRHHFKAPGRNSSMHQERTAAFHALKTALNAPLTRLTPQQGNKPLYSYGLILGGAVGLILSISNMFR